MIRIEIFTGSNSYQGNIPLEEISDVIADPENVIWIDLEDPTPHDFQLLAGEFQFHPLAIEDATKRHQRPKLDQYDTFRFIVFYAVYPDRKDSAFSTQEISFFVGSNYLVTVHTGHCREISATATRWKDNVLQIRSRRIATLLYSILDQIVDNYFPVLDIVAERADAVEEAILNHTSPQTLEEIFQLRKALLALRRVLAPERDLMSMLTRRDIELLGPDTAIYFQDVYDHVLRVTDAIDTYRDLLGGALDAHLSVISNNLNQIMRTLASWSIILMTLALIAGMYGMNFTLTPSQEWPFGFWYSIGLMLVLGGGLFGLFKRINWL
jgi:magnesium transporter